VGNASPLFKSNPQRKISAIEADDLHVGSPDGPKLTKFTLPYANKKPAFAGFLLLSRLTQVAYVERARHHVLMEHQ